MVTTMHKPIADTQEIKKKSKHTTREYYQITKRAKGERNKEITNSQKTINKMPTVSPYLNQ